jgi:diguanylate cyclase (GGDEF)-like protein
MLDIDNFKNFNDLYGHQLGDEILVKLSEVLKNDLTPIMNSIEKTEQVKCGIRKYDIAGRYGGDEFVIILPYCSEEDVNKVAERLNEGIRDIKLPSNPEISITTSFGIAALSTNSAFHDNKEILKMADSALYQAKSQGKNCFFISQI